MIEEWREYSKLVNTYLGPLPTLISEHDKRLHTTFNQAVASTGRLSTTSPNLQAIPIRTELGKEIRSAFVAEQGHRLLSADYSQIELRILAHVSGEPKLREAFARGDDIHTATAAEVLGKDPAELTTGDRSTAKMINFGIVYGISSFGLSENLEISREQAQELIDTYLARFPHVQDFIQRTIEQATRDGYTTSLLGRRRPVPELRASNRQTRSLGERLAVNFVMQGSNADIIKKAMIAIHRRLRDEGRGAKLVLQVHDELLLEVPEAEVSAGEGPRARGDVRRLRPRPAARRGRRRRRGLERGQELNVRLADGYTLFVEPVGDDGLPLIVLHGGPGLDHTHFRPWLDPLAEDFRVLYVDERGQGRSERVDPATLSLEVFARDVDLLAEALGLDRFALLGHSFGAIITTWHAINLGTADAYVISGGGDSSENLMADVEASLGAMGEAGKPIAESWEWEHTVETPEDCAELMRVQAPFHFHGPPSTDFADTVYVPEVLRHFPAAGYGDFDYTPDLGKVTKPTLVIVGAHDRVTTPRANRVLHEGIAGSEYAELDGAGHMSMIEAQDAYLGHVRGFLGRI